jgi:hypothetical protein
MNERSAERERKARGVTAPRGQSCVADVSSVRKKTSPDSLLLLLGSAALLAVRSRAEPGRGLADLTVLTGPHAHHARVDGCTQKESLRLRDHDQGRSEIADP